MSKPVIVLGAGGHARVLIDCLVRNRCEIVGLTVREPIITNGLFAGFPILGSDEAVEKFSPAEIELVNAVGSTRVEAGRQRLYQRMRQLGFRFARVIHDSAIIAESARLAEGAQVMAGAVLQAGAVVGENSLINTATSIDHDVRIASHVHVAPGCTVSGGAQIGEGSHVGAGAVVIQGVTIGSNVLIAAGAVVIRDIPDGARVAGVPARQF